MLMYRTCQLNKNMNVSLNRDSLWILLFYSIICGGSFILCLFCNTCKVFVYVCKFLAPPHRNKVFKLFIKFTLEFCKVFMLNKEYLLMNIGRFFRKYKCQNHKCVYELKTKDYHAIKNKILLKRKILLLVRSRFL